MKRFGVAAMMVSAGFALLSGCGGGDNFDAREVAGLSIERWTSDSYRLDIDLASERHVPQSDSTVVLRSSDKAPLKVTKLEWVAHPERLQALGARVLDSGGNEVSCAAANGGEEVCGAYPGSICLGVSLDVAYCQSTELRAVPFEIASGLQQQIQFIVTKGSGQLDCPLPGASVPEEYKGSYCGELLIETNANNDSGIVKKGNARLYFLVDDKSGEMSLSPQFIEFANAKPGVSQSKTFEVRNTSKQALTIQQITIYPSNGMLSISPDAPLGTSTTIEGESTKTYTLTFNPPASATEEELKFSSDIHFESSSIGNASRLIKVNVTSEGGNAPRITVDPLTLSFVETDNQTITVQNSGETVGQITNLSISPPAARSMYKVWYNDVDILAEFPTSQRPTLAKLTNGEPSTIELVVEFVAPEDPTASTLATLDIRHNDMQAGGKATVTLLGDSTEIALGQVAPVQYTFVAGQAGQTVDFAVYNRGTDPLVITDVTLDLPVGAEEGLFTVSDLIGTIPAGGLLKGTATYSGTVTIHRRATLILTSNTAGETQDMTLLLVAQPPVAAVDLAPSISPSFASQAKVGEVTSFTVSDASAAANLPGSSWLVLDRPAGSSAFLQGSGANASFVPDAAGSYKISVVVPNEESINVQTFFDFEAVN